MQEETTTLVEAEAARWRQLHVAPWVALVGTPKAQRAALAALHCGPSGSGYGSSSRLCRGG